MDQKQGDLQQGDELSQLIQFLTQLLRSGQISGDLPPELRDHPELKQLVSQFVEFQQFILLLANGSLDGQLHMKGRVAGAMKSLQSNLRHLTWQTQRIASGDLSQRVAFLGEFSVAFNTMVENLAETRAQLDERAEELTRQRRAAVNLMLDAQLTREEAEKANLQLQAQLIEIQNLQEKLQEQAIRDPLTGCFNRRYLIETLEREFSRAKRENYPISLLMLDIDYFKRINDTFGHRTGDEVLRKFGSLLRQITRQSDIAARYGGEEFVVVLPNMTLDIAFKRAEEIRLTFPVICESCVTDSFQLSLSIGAAAYPIHGLIYEEVLERADKALYSAKNSGRDRTVCYPLEEI